MTGILKVDQWKDSGDNALITSDGSGALTFNASSITGVATTNGITGTDIWKLTASISGGATTITSNWAQWNTDTARIGSGMTESSGTFTFPETGIWFVQFNAEFRGTGGSRYAEAKIAVTTNNSTYNDRAYAYTSCGNFTNQSIGTAVVSTIIDVTDTSNVKVRFGGQPSASGYELYGSSSAFIQTNAKFIRLGDT